MIDKLYHLVISFLLALYDPVVAVLAALGKEALDLLGFGVAEIGDLIADAIGIFLALFVA